MTEQELKNINTRLNLELFDIGMRAGEDEEPDIPETLQDIDALLAEVQRLQGELEEARKAASFMYGMMGVVIDAVGTKTAIPVVLETRFTEVARTMKGWVDDAQ